VFFGVKIAVCGFLLYCKCQEEGKRLFGRATQLQKRAKGFLHPIYAGFFILTCDSWYQAAF
jgi:hypothetical protein